MKNKVLIGVVIVAVFIISIFFAVSSVSKMVTLFKGEKSALRVGDDIFLVTVADDEAERERGLSGAASLGKNEGMLFKYDAPVIPVFWMRGMNFPIDIIWIADGKVVGWMTDLDPQKGAPESSLRRYSPPGFIDSALEVPAGTVINLNLSVGEAVSINK